MKTNKLKRLISFTMSMAMIVGLAFGEKYAINAYAAGDSVDPAINCFATKEQLRTAFYPDQTTGNYVANSNYNFHTSAQTGRLSFGRKTWKIIGSRTRSTVVGIERDSDIVLLDDDSWGSANLVYNNTTNDCTYGAKTVYANHYGVSKIREYLIERESDENLFSITEQSYMNRTRHEIADRKNDQTDRIEDVFYLPSYSSYHSKVFVGGIVVNISSYTSRNVWLMSTDEGAENSGKVNYWQAATVMNSNSYKDNISVNNTAPYLVAAFNLNVNDCIFASSAVSADSNNIIRSGIIDSLPCMKLRLSASVAPENSAVKNATVGYDTLGNIYVTGASSPIILMVQGRNGTKDWYYSKYIASSVTTTKQLDISTIKNSIADLEGDSIELSKCKIWLESVETDGDTISYATNPSNTASFNYIYAVGSVSPVSGLSNGVPKTSEGLSLPASVTITVIPASSTITSSPVIWDVASSSYDPTNKESQVFEVRGTLNPPAGVVNPNNVTVTILVGVNKANDTSGGGNGGSNGGSGEGNNGESGNGDSNNGGSNGGSDNGGNGGSSGGSTTFDFAAYGLSDKYVPTDYVDQSGSPMVIEGANCYWNEVNGKMYWYENGVKQGTYYDPKGVLGKDSKGNETNRGREICDNSVKDANGKGTWFWLDAVYDGAKAVGKEVWVPYIYQKEAKWTDEQIRSAADKSDPGMGDLVYQYIKEKKGKWVRYDNEGRMLKGWVTIEGALAQAYPKQKGNTYYYDSITGLMAKGYVTIDGVEHHFNEVTGAMEY